MDNQRLAEIEARAKAATEGPWDGRAFDEFLPEDAEFMTHARQDVPDLIAYVRELEGMIAEKTGDIADRLEARLEAELEGYGRK